MKSNIRFVIFLLAGLLVSITKSKEVFFILVGILTMGALNIIIDATDNYLNKEESASPKFSILLISIGIITLFCIGAVYLLRKDSL
jgi:hypothetical protein